jgi:ATP-binding cassette, subfamily B, multidrug efflux pump
VKEANQILVLDDGKEAGLGTHKELLERNELYQEICRIQGIKEGETYESARK